MMCVDELMKKEEKRLERKEEREGAGRERGKKIE
jgi:hypothetical protein